MTQYLSKFQYGEKFERLPDQMELNARGHLILTRTKIDMIPAGLKGVTFVCFNKKPRYIAPDFDGIVMYSDSKHITDLDMLDVELAKARYIREREKVEKPRYIQEKDGSFSLCSLPKDMHVIHDLFEGGYCLDLTRTSVSEKQNLGGFRKIILEPKKIVQEEFPFVLAQKITSHKKPNRTSQKPRTIA